MTLPPGPLRAHPANPRWLGTPDGRAVVLAGSHHWDVLVRNAERPAFDGDAFLDAITAAGHNVLRLWCLESWIRAVHPTPFLRPGPALARDGLPRHQLAAVDPAWLARLRERVLAAGERGLYVVVMLFNGWSVEDKGEGDPWRRHPFHRDNNLDGIDGDPDHEGHGLVAQSLRDAGIVRLEEAYVEQVVDAVVDLPHVLFEIANEAHAVSLPWQRHLVAHVRAVAARRGAAPLVGVTATFPGGSAAELQATGADWISPPRRGGWDRSPPPGDGARPYLVDTDHVFGIGGDAVWAWKVFIRGHHPLYMDPFDGHHGPDGDARHAPVRHALGEIVRLGRRLDLGRLRPHRKLASSRYALASDPGAPVQAVVLLPRGGSVRVELGDGTPRCASWHSILSGAWHDGGEVVGPRPKVRAPFAGPAILVLE